MYKRQLFGAHMLSTVNFLAPGRPMMEMIENQVYLAQEEYSKVIGRSESILAMCQALHYDLVALHVQDVYKRQIRRRSPR